MDSICFRYIDRRGILRFMPYLASYFSLSLFNVFYFNNYY